MRRTGDSRDNGRYGSCRFALLLVLMFISGRFRGLLLVYVHNDQEALSSQLSLPLLPSEAEV